MPDLAIASLADKEAPSAPLTPLDQIVDPAARAAVERMRIVNPKADPTRHIPDVHPTRVPRHIAIIMDGNGRWAGARGFPREFGHRNGAKSVRDALRECSILGVECLTLYSFSSENWKRPDREVSELMRLYLAYMDGEREELVKKNIRFRQIGRREGLPPEAIAALESTQAATAACTGPMLCLAVNYGSRAEIIDAVRTLAHRARDGAIDPNRITEADLERELNTTGIPDPDLLIRTAGEMRISNFLLWQISYSELYVTDTLWPDFDGTALREAIRAYARRERRFGDITPKPSPA